MKEGGKVTDFIFYKSKYLGNSIPDSDFPRLALRSQAQLDRYKRQYRVEGDAEQQNMAVCAMADALYYYEAANGGITSSCSVGSVSSSQATTPPDISPKAQATELYRCAKQYLTIYRGVG